MRSPISLSLFSLSLSISLIHGADASASLTTTVTSPARADITPAPSIRTVQVPTSGNHVQTLELRSASSAGTSSSDLGSSQTQALPITTFVLPSGIASTEELAEKWHVETFWSCVAFPQTTHCGWHEPVLPGGDEIAGAARVGLPGLIAIAGVVMVGFLV